MLEIILKRIKETKHLEISGGYLNFIIRRRGHRKGEINI